MKILEEFWYGNIEPTDYDTSSCKEYKELSLLECGYTEADIETALPDDMNVYYSKDNQHKYGVVGIRIALL